MIRVTCFLKPHRLESLQSAIAAIGVGGLSVSEVRGMGSRAESTVRVIDDRVREMPIRSKVEVIVSNSVAEQIVETMIQAVRTGNADDGKIFLESVQDVVRVRTGERGDVGL